MSSGSTIVEGIDLHRVEKWLNASGIDGRITGPRLLRGGTQNILVRFHVGTRDVVLRRPPRKPRPRNDELLLREARVLGALAETSVPHPRLVAACSDRDILGDAVFLVMDAVDGYNPLDDDPQVLARDGARDRVASGLVDALATIASVDPDKAGLGGFGRPDGFLERQTTRWTDDYRSYRKIDGYAGDELPGFDAVREYLQGDIPADFRVGLMHGDYHPGNVLCSPDDSVAAVVDWEMATIGDPLLDLGRFLAGWPDDHETIVPGVALWAGGQVPPASALAEHYAARSGADMTRLDWYVVMGCFKLGIVLEGTYARACTGRADAATGQLFHGMAVRLFQRASRLVAAQ